MNSFVKMILQVAAVAGTIPYRTGYFSGHLRDQADTTHDTILYWIQYWPSHQHQPSISSIPSICALPASLDHRHIFAFNDVSPIPNCYPISPYLIVGLAAGLAYDVHLALQNWGGIIPGPAKTSQDYEPVVYGKFKQDTN